MPNTNGFATTNVDNLTIFSNNEGNIECNAVNKVYSQTGGFLVGTAGAFGSVQDTNLELASSFTMNENATITLGCSISSQAWYEIRVNDVAVKSGNYVSGSQTLADVDLLENDVVEYWFRGYSGRTISNMGIWGSYVIVENTPADFDITVN